MRQAHNLSRPQADILPDGGRRCLMLCNAGKRPAPMRDERDDVQRRAASRPTPIKIAGVEYFTAADIHRMLGIVRQTLWRWRKAGKIPSGRRYRDRQIVFTRQELEAIREFANRLEPAETQVRALGDGLAASARGAV